MILSACFALTGVGCGDDDRPPAVVDGGRPDARADGMVTPPGDGGEDAGRDSGLPDTGPPPDGSVDLCATVDCTDMDDACHVGVCDPATGVCGQDDRPDGTACDDVNPCTTGDVCTAGACGGTAMDCSGLDDMCNVGMCDTDTASCLPIPRADGTACTDANACTTGDMCSGGVCGGAAVDCTAMMDQCNAAACDMATGMCVRTPVMDGTTCNDMNACTTGDACNAGACTGGATSCASLDTACTVGMCNPTTGACAAVNRPDGTACDDANVCTTTDVCTAGACAGTATCANTCSRATIVMNGTVLAAQDLALGTETVPTGTGCGTGTLFHAMYYTATIPAGQALTFIADPAGTTVDLMVRLLGACGATTCLGNVDAGFAGEPEVLFYENTTGSAQTVVIALGSDTMGVTDRVDVSVRIAAPPSNRVCSTPTALADGVTLTNQQGGLGVDDYTTLTAPCTTSTNNVLYYSVALAAAQGVTITVQPRNAWNSNVRFLGSCMATTCLPGTGAGGGTGAPDVLTYVNTSGAPQTVLLAVGSNSTTNHGIFDITATLGSASNAVCSAATPVVDGTTLTSQQGQFGLDNLSGGTGCGSATNRALYYSTTIPAGAALTAIATPQNTSFSTSMRLMNACGATTCLSSSNTGDAGEPDVLSFDNTTGAPLPVIIAVGSTGTVNFGPFDLSVRIGAPPSNRTCATATPVTSGTLLLAQQGGLGIDNLTGGTSCTATANGVLYYSATVPAGAQLVATALPRQDWSPVLRVLATCADTTCLANPNSGGDGDAETALYTNATAADQPVIIAVGSSSTTIRGLFDLAVQIRPPGPLYAESSLPTACDDMSAGTVLTDVTTDDDVSAPAPLPFAFLVAREPASFYTVGSNGNMQLLPSAFGTTSTSFTNVAIPSTATPNGVVAPFWDDLTPVAGTTDVRVRVIGTAPNRRFVVQWTGYTFFATGEESARMTFQAHLYETTNVIDFHYCSMTTSGTAALITGSGATVGVESLAGALGYQHSFNTASSVSTTNAIRLTPVP